jgi:hypothetical protein
LEGLWLDLLVKQKFFEERYFTLVIDQNFIQGNTPIPFKKEQSNNIFC